MRLMIGHLNWIEDSSINQQLKETKKVVQTVLKPGQNPGASVKENIGIVSSYFSTKFTINITYFVQGLAAGL